jgi:hypothetical protein
MSRSQTSESLELLEQGIKNLANQDNWLQYLKTQAVFHRYSFSNICLILNQCPDASKVAGFGTWKKLNRSVKKGEKSIKIIAPATRKDTEDPDKTHTFFRFVSVFDVSQTDGEPLPEVVTRLEGDDNGMLEALKGFAISKGFRLQEEDMGETNGSCSYSSPIVITLNCHRSPLHKAKTMAHELAHALLHCGENYTGHDAKSSMELEAESVAFVTLQHFGIDSGDYSLGYISHWAASGADMEPVYAQLKKSGASIQKAANEIIMGISGIDEKLVESEALPVKESDLMAA